MTQSMRLDAKQAAIWDESVVPRYLSLFGEAALDMVLTANGGDFAHLGCRTGYLDAAIGARLQEGTLTGVDPSLSALERARDKSRGRPGVRFDYQQAKSAASKLPSRSFTHAMSLHPEPLPKSRVALFDEMARLLVPSGQALVALPLRGSFQEIIDFLREYSVKEDASDLARALDQASLARPTVETLSEELERAGFEYVDIDLFPTVLDFGSGDDLFGDPIFSLAILPELRTLLGRANLDEPLAHVRRALDCYFEGGSFELTVNVGSASGRRALG